MTLTDTHTHLYDEAFAPDGGGEAAVRRALAAGVGEMIFPNVDAASVAPLLELAAKFPGRIHVAMGLHPTEVRADWRAVVAAMEPMMLRGNAVAVGEVGIDLYWDASLRELQREALEYQAHIAAREGLPLIIHCREGLTDTLDILARVEVPGVVMHSFGGTAADVDAVRRVLPDAYFGINGIVTFKNSGLREVLPAIGLDRIVLETDSPYLAPVPKRGRRNESAYLPYIAATVAASLGTDAEAVAAATVANARALFAI